MFFGNFKHIKEVDGKYQYVHRKKTDADEYYGRQFQAIWGYLQIEDIISDPEEQKKFFWHPHACEKRLYIESNRKNSAKNGVGIYYAGIWQELVLKENAITEEWAKLMLEG